MGGMKKQRAKYEPPKRPWQKERIEEELKLIGRYGLRNKREIWKHRTLLANFRSNARDLLAQTEEQRTVKEKELLGRLFRMGILPREAKLDDVLGLSFADLAERRLQTLVQKRGLAKTVHQARQLISHCHITVGSQIMRSPSYIVPRGKESEISINPNSPFTKKDHPYHESVKQAIREAVPEKPRQPPTRKSEIPPTIDGEENE